MSGGLPATLDLVYHTSQPYPRPVPLEEVYTDLTFPSGGDLPYVVLNMVQTLDGAAAIEGRAWRIGTEVDHYLYRTLHGAVDAVLAGAGTLRLEDVVAGTHPHLRERRRAAGRPPTPTAVVLSSTARFDESDLSKQFFRRGDFPSLVLTTARARPEDVARVRTAGAEVAIVESDSEGLVDLRAALRYLGGRSALVLAEGGPRLAGSLLRAQLVREFFLTTTLRLAGDPQAPRIFYAPPPVALAPISLYHYQAGGMLREIYLRAAVTAGNEQKEHRS